MRVFADLVGADLWLLRVVNGVLVGRDSGVAFDRSGDHPTMSAVDQASSFRLAVGHVGGNHWVPVWGDLEGLSLEVGDDARRSLMLIPEDEGGSSESDESDLSGSSFSLAESVDAGASDDDSNDALPDEDDNN